MLEPVILPAHQVPPHLIRYFQAKLDNCYICHMVSVFREVKRVLRKDGTLFVNIGDSYSGGKQGRTDCNTEMRKGRSQPPESRQRPVAPGLKPKDLVGIPWRLAFALQADGWWLRSAITWCKKAPMPESVRDRPTKATEMIFMLTKSERNYWDYVAARDGEHNMWDYWLLGPEPTDEKHFASFPSAIPRRCITAGTSEKGQCPNCGKPWERAVEKRGAPHNGNTQSAYPQGSAAHRVSLMRQAAREQGGEYQNSAKSLGWRPSCSCGKDPIPQIVLDPFCGTGKTGQVTLELGRRFIGIDLKPEYCDNLAKVRLEAAAMGIPYKLWKKAIKGEGT